MNIDFLEKWIHWFGVAFGLFMLTYAIWRGVWLGLKRPPGRTTGAATRFLRVPMLLIFSVLWIGLCICLWKPLPVSMPANVQLVALIIGTLLYFPGISLYLWGARTLGEMYKASSGFGVQLNVNHRLITHGPFAIVRHPLYLSIQLAALGGLLLFRNWTFMFVFFSFAFLFIRARKEEQALALEFGDEWKAYCQKVPFWFPR